jgi:hypothetical protein
VIAIAGLVPVIHVLFRPDPAARGWRKSPAMTNISGLDESTNPLRLPSDFEPDSRGDDPLDEAETARSPVLVSILLDRRAADRQT